MICDAHVHVGTFGFEDIPPEASPRFVADLLCKCQVSEFIFSSLSAQCNASIKDIECEARATKKAFGDGAHAFLWLTGRFYDADPELKVLDSRIWEGVKLHEKEMPWIKERPDDFDRILSILEERCVPDEVLSEESDSRHATPCRNR